jgi:hypothetical protein
MPRLRPVAVLLAPLLAGCVAGGPARSTRSPAPTTPAPATLNTTGPWRLADRAASERVTITTRATVTITGATSVRTDSLRAALAATFAWTGGGARKVDGQLMDYRVAIDSAVPQVPAGLQLPRQFSAVITPAGGMKFTLPPEQSACGDPALSSLQGLHDAWVALPRDLAIGVQWTDTVHTVACPDRVPLRGTIVRRFQLRRAEVENGTRVLIIVERTSRGRLSGEGEQFGERVVIDGESSGSLRYALDPSAGVFVRAEGSTVLSFTLKSSRQNQSVRQSSDVKIVW